LHCSGPRSDRSARKMLHMHLPPMDARYISARQFCIFFLFLLFIINRKITVSLVTKPNSCTMYINRLKVDFDQMNGFEIKNLVLKIILYSCTLKLRNNLMTRSHARIICCHRKTRQIWILQLSISCNNWY